MLTISRIEWSNLINNNLVKKEHIFLPGFRLIASNTHNTDIHEALLSTLGSKSSDKQGSSTPRCLRSLNIGTWPCICFDGKTF